MQEEHPCPFPDCLETFVKSVHVKRHLTSNHGVANPLQWLEDQVCFSQDCDPFLQLPFSGRAGEEGDGRSGGSG